MALSKAVIFDFGGVIVAPREDLTYQACADLFGLPVQKIREVMATYEIQLQRGQMDEVSFWEAVTNDLKLPNAKTLGLLSEIYEKNLSPYASVQAYIRTLQAQGITTALITNTEEPHARINKKHHLYDLFHPAVLSHEVGMRKPDREIYEYTLQQLGLPGEQCVYVDDLPENLVPAKKLGMDTIHCTGPDQLLVELKSRFADA